MGGRQGRRWLARALGLALVLQLLLLPSPAEALSWRLPGRGGAAPARPAGERAGRQLREVPPPAWVQKAKGALEERDPTVRILAPADGDLLPDGPWTLRLRVSDWPLVDAGPLGLGPHLVVQLDGAPPRPVVATEVEMPALSPGSHRLTVYAAKPWGEAHKSPLALHQIRLHRLAPNPATLPAPGTPQLIPVSPSGLAGDPPLLLDWLLIDAPLQGLRGDASGWRLRLTVNGESVLLDQQMPLWLQGWTSGSNALLLELLDGRGEPLNPPFNSLLREVIVPPAGGTDQAFSAPATDLELAVLLGDRPPSALPPVPSLPSAPDQPPAPEPRSDEQPEAEAEAPSLEPGTLGEAADPSPSSPAALPRQRPDGAVLSPQRPDGADLDVTTEPSAPTPTPTPLPPTPEPLAEPVDPPGAPSLAAPSSLPISSPTSLPAPAPPAPAAAAPPSPVTPLPSTESPDPAPSPDPEPDPDPQAPPKESGPPVTPSLPTGTDFTGTASTAFPAELSAPAPRAPAEALPVAPLQVAADPPPARQERNADGPAPQPTPREPLSQGPER